VVCRVSREYIPECSILQNPFTHESLLIEDHDQKLTRAEKRLAKEAYEREKKFSVSFSRQSFANFYSNKPTPAPPVYRYIHPCVQLYLHPCVQVYPPLCTVISPPLCTGTSPSTPVYRYNSLHPCVQVYPPLCTGITPSTPVYRYNSLHLCVQVYFHPCVQVKLKQ